MLSVIVITKNEAHQIETCLSSVAWADEIIVVDSGSHDQTVALARQYTDKVYQADWNGFGPQKQLALSYATGDWVLNIDADEIISPKLASEIQAVLQNPKNCTAWRIPITMRFYDKILKRSLRTNRHIRLFKRSIAHYSNDLVHEKIILPNDIKINKLNNAIIHNSYQDLTEALDKLNNYSSLTAVKKLASGEGPQTFGDTGEVFR